MSENRGNENVRIIIGLSGPIASGKTLICQYLSDKHSFCAKRFSDVVKNECKENEIDLSRKDLQRVGKELVEKQGCQWMVKQVISLSCSCKYVILDSIRHIGIHEVLNEMFSNSYKLIFIQSPYDVRMNRFLERQKDIDKNLGKSCFDRIEKHDVESEISQLRNLCYKEFNNDGPMDSLFKEIDFFIEELSNKIDT